MKIENEFTVSAPIARAWEILNDIPLIAPCMPGAVLTNSEGDVHEGKVKIKVGPVTSEYKGKAEFLESDEVNHKLVIKGEGRDTRGAGNANADITLTMKADGDNKTIVNVDTDLKITGKVAQFGRGVIVDISQKLLGQFVDCLETKIGTVEDDAAKIAEAGAAAAVETGDSGATGAGSAAEAAAAGSMGIGKTAAGDVDVSGESAATDCWPDGSSKEAGSGAADAAAGKVAGVAGAAAGGLSGTAAGVAAGAAGAVGAAGAMTGKAKSMTGQSQDAEPEVEALDLMDIAGGAVYKRLIPVAIVGLILLALIIWLVVR